MTNKGANSNEGVGAEGLGLSGLDATAQAGETLFLANGCTACHNVNGVGAPGPGPNLSNEGTQGHPPEFYEGFLKDPPGNVMPNFTTFTPEEYKQLGTFLSGLGTTYK
jgi:mono/diheme cytochrome c family protein